MYFIGFRNGMEASFESFRHVSVAVLRRSRKFKYEKCLNTSAFRDILSIKLTSSTLNG